MASITSLGVHRPIGLERAIEEGILPSNPLPSSYSWEVVIDKEADVPCEDELLTTETCVLWSRGGIFRKSFRSDLENEPVTQALLAYFPASADNQHSADSKTEATEATEAHRTTTPALCRALVIFLKTQAHIYFLSGASHVVHMPFEVESACAAPCGVIIQRKYKGSNAGPLSLRMPKVPPNSFLSSQLAPFPAPSQSTMDFSVEGLGKPKTLPLRLSSTLGNMQLPIEAPESRWPRLVCLTDPLLEIGLVVAQPERSRRRSSTSSLFLNPADEIIHVEEVKIPIADGSECSKLCIAVTVNREASMYTIWRLTYLERDEPFTGKPKQKKTKPSRRRSSMPPIASGSATPVHPSVRESFGAPLPGKKTRKSVKIEGKDRVLDKALSSLDPEKGNDATRRQSRRVSSLLARADLSTSQDRTSFADQPHLAHGGRRVESHGSQKSRMSGPSFGGGTLNVFNHGLNSLSEADSLLEELRAGGDFEGFHNMGLDDNDFDGLTHEMLLTKIHSFPMDNINVRYSLSSQPARTQAKVFVLIGPPTANDDQGRTPLLVGIQDPVDKRLQLLTFHVEKPEPTRSKRSADADSISVVFGELRRVQSVVDSCKLTDHDEKTMIILTEDKTGGRELSLQSPWGKVTKVTLPLLYHDNLNSLEYSGSHTTNKEVRGRRSLGIGISGAHIEAISHPHSRGVFDLVDRDGGFHRIKIRLRPSSPQVCRALDVCRSVLPAASAEKILTGWWHIMQWLHDVDGRDIEQQVTDREWSAFVLLMLASFLTLEGTTLTPRPPGGKNVDLSAQTKWEAMGLYVVPNSSVCAPWMRTKSWQWLLDEGLLEAAEIPDEINPPRGFMATHIGLARQYLASADGLSLFGPDGYLPTALRRDLPGRNMAAWSMMMGLHVLLEEQRLTILALEESSPCLTDLRVLLHQLAKWLAWPRFQTWYALGMPIEPEIEEDPVVLTESTLTEPSGTYCVLSWVQQHLTAAKDKMEFPTLEQVHSAANQNTPAQGRQSLWRSLTPRIFMFDKLFNLLGSISNHVEMVVAMHGCGFTPRILETLPEAVLTPLQDVIFMCQSNPPSTWPRGLLSLINRTDIDGILQPARTIKAHSEALAPSHTAKWDFRMICQHIDDLHDHVEETNGSERQAVVRALFREDRRLNEAQNLLSATKPRVLRLDPKRDWSESEYLERQKDLVTMAATGTLAIPAGRGLLYYALRFPLLTQKYHIGGFNLTCIIKPPNNTVGVDKSLFTEEKINWAFFHQGVAGGLAISPHAKGIDTSWILYNKPGQDLSNRHAGFLLALGLNGHLKSVAKWVAFKYLTPKHTMTSIGLLLGLAASYIGTMDSLITRLLSVHVTRMLPRGAAELNLSKHTQTTGVMGIGLLYCNSQHRRMSEIMMSEIEYTDDYAEEDPLRDEGYRLAAGFALGFINLGKGNDLKGLRDMRLTEKLLTLSTAPKRVELVHVLDRSAAGAVMAIALIYMKTGDHIVARKIDVPDTVVQFDYVRPDVLLLRTMAKNIILWDEIEPSFEWVGKSLPADYRSRALLTGVVRLQSRDLCFFTITAGICWALGLRFAGSANTRVRDLLIHYLDQFIRIVRLPGNNFDSELTRTNVRMCMDVVALSCATIMAGTGDLVVLRRLRSLHGRDDAITTYGSHLAAHLAIGALFLGCGTATFGTSNLATASLIVAFYPLFPNNVQDNRCHLQAFRHFWVLATDPRCFVTKDLATGQPVNVPIRIELKPKSASGKAAIAAQGGTLGLGSVVTIRKQTPCLLPPLEDVARVTTDASAMGFWNLTLDFEKSPHLIEDFKKNQSVYLRHRPAHERPYPATLRALSGSDVGFNPAERDPIEWIFKLDALKDLTHAERAVVLDLTGAGGGVGEGEGASTAIDATLVLKTGLDGISRDRLLGLRLLFEWADRRAALVRPAAPKEADKKGKKVSLEVDGDLEGAGQGGWWLRDSVVEELKGATWLAGRGE